MPLPCSRFLLAITLTAVIAPLFAVGDVVDSTPSLKIKTTDGRNITSASVAGKLVVVHFWSRNSRPCFKHAPVLADLHKKYSEKGVQFVGVCLDRISDDTAAYVAGKFGFNWFQSVDARNGDNALASVFDVKSMPVAVLISTKGRVLWKGHPAELEPQIAFALKAYPPKPVALIDYEIAIESLQQADALTRKGAYVEAFRLIDAIAPDVRPDAAMKQLAAKVSSQIRPSTSDHARLINLAKAKFPTALDRLSALRDASVVTPKPNDPAPTQTNGSANTTTISQAALISRLKLAERYAKAGNDVRAFDVYVWIVEKAPRTGIGKEAAAKVARYEADPAFMARHKVLTEKRLSERQLALAIELEALKQIEPARQAYLKLIADYPRSLAAAKAKIRLEKLPAKPGRD